jgi:hypothetical protein
LSAVNVAETVLVFVGAPLAVVALLALLIFLPGARHKRSRYRSGQPWEHDPVWYEPHPDGLADGHGGSHAALAAGHAQKAGPLGGARGTW